MARCFHKQRFFSITFLLFFSTLSLAQVSDNPAMPGFDHDGSDAEAMAIADEVMQALGGRENWDNTRYVTWKFFGRRLHVWDKWTGNIRFEGNDMLALMNLNTREGRAWKNGTEITHPDAPENAPDSSDAARTNDPD